MAELNVKIDSGNAAFSDGEGGASEAARILRHIADQIEGGYQGGGCLDINGNSVGSWDFEPSAERAICYDCGTESIPEAIGQVCQTCGRGVIEEDHG